MLARNRLADDPGNRKDRLGSRLEALRSEVRACVAAVDRVAIALYDAGSGTIKTFLSSPPGESPLAHYRIPLASATWLDEVRRSARPRVINSFRAAALGEQRHSRDIAAAGFKSSYTVPVFGDAGFLGFVFFNSRREQVFSEAVTRQLDLYARIICLALESAQRSVAILTGGLAVLRQVSRFRDDETGEHLARMSYYSELIALAVAPHCGLDDEWAEYVRLYAPLHDIGKIAVPDAVVFKPGPLEPAEFEVMKGHAAKGEEILAGLVRELGLEAVPHIRSLLQIARHHHEAWDGSGYPDGLKGRQIPLVARIVKVADAFDALVSRRCYKEPWPMEQAAAYLRKLSGVKFDPRCVEAFARSSAEVEAIIRRCGA
jgi:HD-GYP domain-containing protein (c-di-GMP phosphodiesterase class II)